MSFSQQNYQQLLSDSPTDSIASSGSLLTAFSNLLYRWGEGVDPPSLNNVFKNNGGFISNKLTWSSISFYDNNIVIQDVGSGMPTTVDTIVRFYHTSTNTGVPIEHYCLVDHIINDQLYIVDSLDGRIKSPSEYEYIYNKPTSWASYVKNPINNPVIESLPLVEIPSTLPQAPLDIPVKKQVIRIYTTLMTFRSHTHASLHIKAVGTLPPSKYYVLKTSEDGMLYISKRRINEDRYWINPKDNIEEETLSSKTEAILFSNQWKETMQWFNEDHSPVNYVSNKSLLIIDADRRGPSKPLPKDTQVGVYGSFVKDNIEYARLFLVEDTHKIYWHCVQPKYLQVLDQWIADQMEVFDDTTTLEDREAYHTLTWHDHYVHFKAHIRQFFVNIGILDEIHKEKK